MTQNMPVRANRISGNMESMEHDGGMASRRGRGVPQRKSPGPHDEDKMRPIVSQPCPRGRYARCLGLRFAWDGDAPADEKGSGSVLRRAADVCIDTSRNDVPMSLLSCL